MDQNNKIILNNNLAKLDILNTKLRYCKEILINIRDDESLFPVILEKMVITSNDFYSYINNYQKTSITILDEMLLIIKENKRK